jgi:uncharacterized protein (TIGR01777 family)
VSKPNAARYVAATTLPVSQQTAFLYHERPGALPRLIPRWQKAEIERSDGSLKAGSRVVLRAKLGPIPLRWYAKHTEYDPPRLFVDVQESGPFASWEHRHRFEVVGDESSVLTDDVRYRLPIGAVGNLFGAGLARRQIESMFAYRHRVTRDDLQLTAKYPTNSLRIGISGSSGLVGSRLCSLLTLLGHQVVRLERSTAKTQGAGEAIAPWSSDEEADKLSTLDAVVHLAGKSIASQRWSGRVKQQIRSSRVDLTEQLSQRLARLDSKPSVFVCASATGIYGDTGDEVIAESAAHGATFLAETAEAWEQACQAARDAGIRVANARFSMILDPQEGALAKMLLPAKFFGGTLGSGKQWWSWIGLDDAVGALYHAIMCDQVEGPFNVTAPNPLRNREFVRVLAGVLNRLAIVPAPEFGLRLLVGEMADALLLTSCRVTPDVLVETGYTFRFDSVEQQLRYCLGKDRLESIE